MKDSFILYTDQKEVINMLTDVQAGKLFKAIYEYETTGNIPEMPNTLKCIFIPIKQSLTRNKEKSRCEKYHWNWKGGISDINHKIRNSSKYRLWRNQVFSRDNYTCQICNKKSVFLNAHHIEKFSQNIDKRIDVSNGLTLCRTCHINIHKKRCNYEE